LELSRIPTNNVFQAGGRTIRLVTRMVRPEVMVFADVLSKEECSELIELSRAKLQRSYTVDPGTGQLIVVESRTSFSTFFKLKENELVGRIESRLAELLCWPSDHAEGLQVLRYGPGAEYKPHYDYFPVSETGSAVHVASGGQRIGSLLLYLNDVEEGGETIFPEISLTVVPLTGYALYFGYCNSQNQVDPLTLHGGAPVKRGEKWVATKWLRQKPRG
jgi:prolyl 4-hydroxylase